MIKNYNSETKRANCRSCSSGYYLNKENICTICPTNCKTCHLNNDEVICDSCKGGSYLNGETCEMCALHCTSCQNRICIGCSSGYQNYEGECFKCPDNCSKCQKESNGNIICTICDSYYALNSQKLCSHCPDNCDECNFNNNDLICTSCIYNSNTILVNNKCSSCENDIPIGGPGCLKCYENNKINYCIKCSSNDFVFITNRYKCLSNLDSNEENLYGCLNATEENNGKYKCNNSCKPGFIPILNENKCKKPEEINLTNYCLNANNKNSTDYPLYSCYNCLNYNNYLTLYKIIDNISITS